MGFLVRLEAMATPLVGLEGSGLPTLKEALVDVVGKLSDRATVVRLNKAIQTGQVVCFSTLHQRGPELGRGKTRQPCH
jgi:hypothetical protein